ncbi:MAG: GNAT family N-acetyltransferase [Chloroflexia bacterium]|nr:GNAT family N-acetyltransferase [Chloroflexia bacterium]
MIIRKYENSDETGWLYCRVLAFINTLYFDNVLNRKEKYKNDSIELVAEINGEIVGLIDVELDSDEVKVTSSEGGFGGMIWHIAVHPKFQGKGIGSSLLKKWRTF